MKKFTPIALFVTSALSAPILAQAATFSVDIEITDQQTALTLSESTKMKFPTIIIDGQRANNQICYTYANNSNLCPSAVVGTDKNNSTFAVTGTPLDSVSINLPALSDKTASRLTSSAMSLQLFLMPVEPVLLMSKPD